jgi:hypothetical protein
MRMRPLKSLTLESIISLLSDTFSQMDDRRDPNRIDYSLHDTLMSGFGMFFFQHPSLLQFQQAMAKKRGLSNLQTIFGVHQLPSESQMREVLDSASPDQLRRLLPTLFELVRRAGWAEDYKTKFKQGSSETGYYTIALDGTEYFNSTALSCESCLETRDKNGVVHYHHSVVAATLVRAGSHAILPLDGEMVANTDGTEKQDCEINAAKRLVERLRSEHRQMEIILSGDDLYSRAPFIDECLARDMHFVFVAKPDSHKELMDWVEDFQRLGEIEEGRWQEGPASKRRYFRYRIARLVPINGERKIWVNFVEVWETNKEGRQLYHNSWVTDLEVSRENVEQITAVGRSKWKIENEQFNVQKNHGYELEHNYGHGKKNLSVVFYHLNLLAFVTHKIIERGDRLYQKCREGKISLREMWNGLRTLMNKIVFESWTKLLEFWLCDDVPGS